MKVIKNSVLEQKELDAIVTLSQTDCEGIECDWCMLKLKDDISPLVCMKDVAIRFLEENDLEERPKL